MRVPWSDEWLSGKAYNFVLFQVLILSSKLVNLFGWCTKLQNESTLCNDEWLLETELSISQFNIWIHTRLHIFITTFTTHKKIYHKFFSHLLKLEAGRQNLRQLNSSFTTISSHFSAIYISIFHKTEVQTVILRCWMGL